MDALGLNTFQLLICRAGTGTTEIMKETVLMDALGLNTFQPLTCPCGGATFVKVVGLSSRAGTGTTETMKGYACHACQAVVDMAAMQQALELKLLETEIQERRARMQAMTPASGTLSPR